MIKVKFEISWFIASGKQIKEATPIFEVTKEGMEALLLAEIALNDSCPRRYHLIEVE